MFKYMCNITVENGYWLYYKHVFSEVRWVDQLILLFLYKMYLSEIVFSMQPTWKEAVFVRAIKFLSIILKFSWSWIDWHFGMVIRMVQCTSAYFQIGSIYQWNTGFQTIDIIRQSSEFIVWLVNFTLVFILFFLLCYFIVTKPLPTMIWVRILRSFVT